MDKSDIYYVKVFDINYGQWLAYCEKKMVNDIQDTLEVCIYDAIGQTAISFMVTIHGDIRYHFHDTDSLTKHFCYHGTIYNRDASEKNSQLFIRIVQRIPDAIFTLINSKLRIAKNLGK